MGSEEDMHSLSLDVGRGMCLLNVSDEEEDLEVSAGDGVDVRCVVQVFSVGFVVRPFSAAYCEERV